MKMGIFVSWIIPDISMGKSNKMHFPLVAYKKDFVVKEP
jgi:hypothetical protein